jgi:hypothetical protein
MQCYTHQDREAVVECSEECGRGLCVECAELYETPVCIECIRLGHYQRVHLPAPPADIYQRFVRNMGMFILLVVFLVFAGLYGGEPPEWMSMFLVPLLVWGFMSVHDFEHRVLSEFSLVSITSFGYWLIVRLVGAVLLAALSPLILPIVLLRDWYYLRKLRV